MRACAAAGRRPAAEHSNEVVPLPQEGEHQERERMLFFPTIHRRNIRLLLLSKHGRHNSASKNRNPARNRSTPGESPPGRLDQLSEPPFPFLHHVSRRQLHLQR